MVTGQEKICNLIEKSTLDTFPRTLMLVGPEGSGKHLLCNEIKDKFQLISFDITEMLTLDTINEIYQKVEPYLYLIRINEISIREENIILKLLEEPLKNSYIILLAESVNDILPTILNRCQIWYLQNYTREYLSTFVDKNLNILDIAETPGQAVALASEDFQNMIILADKMITKIHVATIPNTLTIADKIAWSNEKDKFNYTLFLKVLISRILYYNRTNVDTKLTQLYHLTNNLQVKNRVKNIDKRYLFEKYLLEARSIMKGSIA